MIWFFVMWSMSTQNSESNSSSNVDGASQDNKRSLNDSPTGIPVHRSATKLLDTYQEKRLKYDTICTIHGKNSSKTDESLHDMINKWQLSNFTSCVYDNAVNSVLDSIISSGHPMDSEHALSHSNSLQHDFTLENEAVLMAIERKGLKQQDSPTSDSLGNISNSKDRSFSSKINCFYNSDEHVDLYQMNSKLQQQLSSNDESVESNFENNFMTTAVSAAIEEKGLSMYHV